MLRRPSRKYEHATHIINRAKFDLYYLGPTIELSESAEGNNLIQDIYVNDIKCSSFIKKLDRPVKQYNKFSSEATDDRKAIIEDLHKLAEKFDDAFLSLMIKYGYYKED